VTDREDRDGEQLELGLPNSSAPPATRADCPTERPCPKYGCKHHNHTDTDRAGRPYGGRAPEPKLLPQHVRDRVESCSLDVGDRGEHDTNYVAKQCNETPRRVLQVEARAQQKVAIALMLEEVLDEHLRSKLPPGAKLETVYPRNVDDSGHVHIHLVFSVGKVSPLVRVRKK
jgi:hypothetical protein